MAEKRNYSKKPMTPGPIQANEYGKLPPDFDSFLTLNL